MSDLIPLASFLALLAAAFGLVRLAAALQPPPLPAPRPGENRP